MLIHPLEDRILIECGTEKSVSTSGIVIPESAKEEYPAEGKIVEVGPDVKSDKLTVGTRILFSKFAGDDVELGGLPFKIVREESVSAYID